MTWFLLSQKDIEELIGFEFEAASEFYSDIAMCKLIGFDFVAYLNMVVFSQIRDRKGAINENLALRTSMVKYALTDDKELTDAYFYENIYAHCEKIDQMLKREVNKSITEEQKDEIVNSIKADLVQRVKSVHDKSAKVVFPRAPKRDIREHMPEGTVLFKDKLAPAQFYYRKINTFVMICESMSLHEQMSSFRFTEADKAYLKSVAEIYSKKNGITELWHKSLTLKEKSLIEWISIYKSHPNDDHFKRYTMLKDALDFIQEFYYRNRFRCAQQDVEGSA
jgi:hypothetical protein